ncbi:MAG: hypothetical protein EOO42_00260 [Flavobacteriales bacterium]|nr:MAG: hypothetical protein EOO42_00260 [Flavobacteriales bacterium]
MKPVVAKLFCLLAILHLFLLVSCGDDDLKNASTISSKQLVLSKDRSYGVDIVYSDSAKVKAKGYAPILDKVTPSTGSTYNEMPKGVKIEFFDEFLKKTGTITSDYAINKVGEKITIFRKHVVVVMVTSGITFTTEELIWDENKKLYTSPYGTVIGKDGERMTGTKFSAPQDFSTYYIIDASGETTIKGDLTQ